MLVLGGGPRKLGGDRVWSEEEKINFASTPMFLVRAVRAGGAV